MVGQWQQGMHLKWYARTSNKNNLLTEVECKSKIARIKEAEQDALSETLGFPVVRRHHNPVTNPNVKKVICYMNEGYKAACQSRVDGWKMGEGQRETRAPKKLPKDCLRIVDDRS